MRAARPRRADVLPGACLALMLFGAAVALAVVASPSPNDLQYLDLVVLSAPACLASGVLLLSMRLRYGVRRRAAAIPFAAGLIFLVGPLIRISTLMDVVFAATAVAAAVLHARVIRSLVGREMR